MFTEAHNFWKPPRLWAGTLHKLPAFVASVRLSPLRPLRFLFFLSLRSTVSPPALYASN